MELYELLTIPKIFRQNTNSFKVFSWSGFASLLCNVQMLQKCFHNMGPSNSKQKKFVCDNQKSREVQTPLMESGSRIIYHFKLLLEDFSYWCIVYNKLKIISIKQSQMKMQARTELWIPVSNVIRAAMC